MILIIGGAYQGKLDYAKEKYGLTDSDVFTCEEGSTAVGFDEKIVDHFERYIFSLIKAGQVPEKAVGMQLRANRYKGRIIICDDISQGVVPMDATERAWREGVGRTLVKIAKQADGIRFTEDDGATWTDLADDTIVSMNMWGLTPSLLDALEAGFPGFLAEKVPGNPQKAEYLLPMSIGELLKAGKATVKVLHSADKWYGVTYAADKPHVVAALKEMTAQGKYPDGLWK